MGRVLALPIIEKERRSSLKGFQAFRFRRNLPDSVGFLDRFTADDGEDHDNDDDHYGRYCDPFESVLA